ncbi:MAG TPA: hypothetical protein VK826_00365 [Bacteroidia bacterium]|nr:hypothetical protein [Bacteroidia bacterium]
MTLAQKKKEVISLIGSLDESHLDALLILLRKPIGKTYVSESDWAIAAYRRKQVEEGKSKLIPARESLERMEKNLKKKKK